MGGVFPYSTSGPAIADYAIIKGLYELGYDIEVFTKKPFTKKPYEGCNTPADYYKRIKINYIESRLLTYLNFLKNFIRCLTRSKIVYFSSPPVTPILLLLFILSKLFNKKTIYYLMGSLLNINKDTYKSKVFKYLIKHDAIYKVIMPLHCEREFKIIYGKSNRIVVIPHGIVIDAYENLKKERLAGEVNILFSGHLTQIKGILDLVKAFINIAREFDNVHLYITGTGNLKKTIQNFLTAMHLTEKVHLLGYVPYEKLKSLYTSVDIFVSPSLEENMSISMLEAMTSGCAIICSDISAREVIEHGKNGLVFKAGDVEGLTHNLRELLLNKDKVNYYAEAAKMTIKKKFDYKIIAKKLDKILQEISISQK